MMAAERVLSRRMMVLGWLCVFGIGLVIFDLVRLLPDLPDQWWHPEQPPVLDDSGMHFDLRSMFVDFGLAWIGAWGYIGAFVWLPVAAFKAIRAARRGLATQNAERILFLAQCILLATTSALVHLTPLRYPHYNIPLL